MVSENDQGSTPTRKEQAFQLFDEGKLPRDIEVKALGLASKTRYNYYQVWKNERSGAAPTVPANTPKPSTRKGGAAAGAIAVGKITITPENWGMDQLGAILILDTYNKTKRDIGYTGTVGDFLCDMCEFYRRVLGYTEVEYARQTTGGEGGDGSTEDGSQSPGQQPELLPVG